MMIVQQQNLNWPFAFLPFHFCLPLPFFNLSKIELPTQRVILYLSVVYLKASLFCFVIFLPFCPLALLPFCFFAVFSPESIAGGGSIVTAGSGWSSDRAGGTITDGEEHSHTLLIYCLLQSALLSSLPPTGALFRCACIS